MDESALNVKIPTELKDEVKIQATRQHITIRTFVINALNDRLKECANESNTKNS